MTERIQEFLRNRHNEGQDVEPCLVVDLEVVRDNYQTFSAAQSTANRRMPSAKARAMSRSFLIVLP